ncbi:acyltransferase 3 [Rhypophila sp. PSN 637]
MSSSIDQNLALPSPAVHLKPGAAAAPTGLRPPRRHDIDNLRSFCTAHVIAHHTAIAYGGISGAGLPPQAHSGLFDHASPLFTPFIATNLSYGMGLYFFLSGQMTAQSMSRSKSDWGLIRTKLWRLGMPALLYSALIDPVGAVIARPEKTLVGNLGLYVREVGKLDGVRGPVWYNATLIVFDICAVVLRRVLPCSGSPSLEFVKAFRLLGRWGWLGVAGASFLLRTKLPPGEVIPVIGVDPAYLLQYIYGYALGHAAFHVGERSIPGPENLSVYKAYAISLGTLPLLFLPGFLKGEGIGGAVQLGGWNWAAAIYAVWNELSFYTLAPAVMQAFERNYNRPAGKGLWSPRYSYAAFLLHTLVSWVADLGLARLLKRSDGTRPAWMSNRAWQAFGPLLVTAAMSAVDILGSFKLGQLLIDHVPGVGSLL